MRHHDQKQPGGKKEFIWLIYYISSYSPLKEAKAKIQMEQEPDAEAI